jgi:hypothetical protein
MNGHRIKIGIGTILLIVSGVVAWYVNTQAGIDKEQNVQIEGKVDKDQYWFDQNRIFEILKEIREAVGK